MSEGAGVDDLLEPVLGALEGVGGDQPFQLGGEERLEPGADGLESEGQMDGADECLERRREDRGSASRADPLRPLAELEGAPEADPAGDARKPGGTDDRGPAGRELALVGVGVALVEGL